MPEFHPLANAFPLLTGEAFDELVEDVKVNGVLDPVVMYEGKILDGRNRWRAAQKLEMPHSEVKLEELVKHNKAPEDPVAFVWSKNAVRRQLTTSQRAMAATKLTDTGLGANQHTKGKTTIQRAADLAGVGERTVQRAKTVVDKGVPEVVEAVEAGELAVKTAAEIVTKPAEIQKKIMEDGAEEAAKKVAASRASKVVPAKPDGPGRGQVGPKTTMTRQMEGSSAEGSKARAAFWAENKELIASLDRELLDQFVSDLSAERRAIEQLLKVIRTEVPSETAPKAPAKKTAAPRVRKPVAKKTTAPKKVAEVLPSAAKKAAAAKKTTAAPVAEASTTESQESK